jgi:hypothetical protein
VSGAAAERSGDEWHGFGILGQTSLTVGVAAARGSPSQEECDMARLPKWLAVACALVVLALVVTPVLAEETKGKIKSVSADKKEFVFTDQNNKDWTFMVADDTKIKLADKDVKLTDLKAGAEATVVYEKKGDKLIAKEVRVK